MGDQAHDFAERKIAEFQAEVRETYQQAQADAQEALSRFLERFEKEDERKREKVNAGELSEADYKAWRKGKILRSRQLSSTLEQVSQAMTEANQVAVAALAGRLLEVYAENANYAAFQVCEASGLDLAFSLVDAPTVQHMLTAGEALFSVPALDVAKDVAWNRRLMASQLTQGVLLGESIPKMARRVQRVTGSNIATATRTARTAVTGAECAGRVSSYERARDMGIKLKQEWVATLDGRTRHSHRKLDGEKAEVGGTFPNGCRFPGDPTARYAEICNCRCTLVAAVEGFETDDAKRWSRLPEGMTYEEWKAGGSGKKSAGGTAVSEGERAKRPPRSERISASPKYAADMGRVSSKGYRAMLAQAVGEEAAGGVNSAIKKILRHRGGTNGEDLYAIDLSTGRTVTSCVTSKAASMVSPGRPFRKKLEDAVEGGARVALLHNHPASSMPSASDLESLVENGCELGVIACHNGDIYTFRKVSRPLAGYNIRKYEQLVSTVGTKDEERLFKAVETFLGIRIEHLG